VTAFATTVIVMAKAPRPGVAKTRLIPALGADGAAQLAQRLLDATITRALAAGVGRVELCCAPDASDPAFTRIAREQPVGLTAQGDGDLGQRMARAIARALEHGAHVLLLGTDAPTMDAHCLREANAALLSHDAVFVPALDGGYLLVGLRRPAPMIFEGMTWSTPQVMDDTRLRLRRAGLTHCELPALPDIDEPADLVHLPPGWR
jgi:rSAM/selenodomain-associated transferase 1